MSVLPATSRRRPPARAAAVLAALAGSAALAAPAGAELVVFADGGWLKVAGYEVRGERARIELAGGGTMTVDLSRIERVVDDEVVRPVEVAAEPAAAPAAPAWRFAAGGAAPATPFGVEIFAAAERHGLDPALVAAVVRAESAFDPRAVSRKGARGLMQLMPATAGRFGLGAEEIHDPAKNLDAGARYLAWLLERFGGDLLRALAAYNAGEGTVERYGGVPPFRETRDYLRRIYSTLGFTT
jgi:soluble lytic murein transglycosylase-like protein